MFFRWTDVDPNFDAIDQLKRRMWSLFDEFGRRRETTEGELGGWPLTNFYETADTFLVRAEVPGLSEKEVNLQVHENTLTISGERKSDVPEGYSVHRQERGPVKFSRSYSFNTQVDPEKTTATIKDGVLTVKLAKAESAKPRQILVKGQ